MKIPIQGLLVTLTLASKCVADDPVTPTLRLPFLGDTATYMNSSSFAVAAQLEPPLSIRAEVQLFQVRDDGALISQGRFTTPFSEEGLLVLDVTPPARGWAPGTMRCVVSLIGIPEQRQSYQVRIVDGGGQAEPIREPVHSEIVIDLDNRGDNAAPHVVAGQLFDIRGSLVCTLPEDQLLGPSVRASIIRPANGRNVTMQSEGSRALRDSDLTCTFEIEIGAPDLFGDCVLELMYPVADPAGGFDYQRVEMPLVIDPPGERDD